MERQWQEYSMFKKGVILAIALFIAYLFATNMHALANMIRTFFVILAPFVTGIAIAYFLARPVMKFAAVYNQSGSKFVRRKAHVLAVITVFLMLILAVTIIIIYITPIIRDNVVDLVNNLDVYYADAIAWLNSIEPHHFLYSFLPDTYEITSIELLTIFGDGSNDLLSFISSNLMTVVGNIVSFTTSIMNFAMGLIIALYLLLYKESVLGLVDRIARATIKPDPLKFIKDYVHKANGMFYKFISAQFLDACILGTLATILLAILGVEYAVTFGIMLGIFNMIPFFGSIIATLITVFITFFTGGMNQALLTFGLLLLLQQIDAQFINPKITGDSLGLNPLVVVTSILIGASFGILGMFIAVPIAGILKVFLDDFLAYREQKLGLVANSPHEEQV